MYKAAVPYLLIVLVRKASTSGLESKIGVYFYIHFCASSHDSCYSFTASCDRTSMGTENKPFEAEFSRKDVGEKGQATSARCDQTSMGTENKTLEAEFSREDVGRKDQATSANVSSDKDTSSIGISRLFRPLVAPFVKIFTPYTEPVLRCSKCDEALKLKKSQLDNPDAIATIRCRK